MYLYRTFFIYKRTHIRQNKFKFVAFGREVNKYLKDIEIPDEAPEWIKNANYSGLKTKNVTPIELRNINSWKKCKCKDLFDVERGNLANLNDCADGTTPVVSAFGRNEGI